MGFVVCVEYGYKGERGGGDILSINQLAGVCHSDGPYTWVGCSKGFKHTCLKRVGIFFKIRKHG